VYILCLAKTIEGPMDDYLNLIKGAIERDLETQKLNKEKRSEAARMINGILSEFGTSTIINENDVEFTGSLLTNRFLAGKPFRDENETTVDITRNSALGKAIFDAYYKVPNETRFFHYTSLIKFENIVTNRQLRLFNLVKRFSQDEFKPFYSDHGLTGYDAPFDFDERPAFYRLMTDIFYMSFVKTSALDLNDQDQYYKSFGEDKGVRIEFELKPNRDVLRDVYYAPADLSSLPLARISSEIRTRFDRQFMFSGISRAGGYYLKGDFSGEQETRLLIKKGADDYSFNFVSSSSSFGDVRFINLDFQNDFVNIKVLSVHTEYTSLVSQIKQILQSNGMDDVYVCEKGYAI
jgi:hypothetical protein